MSSRTISKQAMTEALDDTTFYLLVGECVAYEHDWTVINLCPWCTCAKFHEKAFISSFYPTREDLI